MNQPRQHHFVPKSFLARFTRNRMVGGELWVLDQMQRRQWRSTPTKTARQRDLNSVDLGADVDPMFVEKGLGDLEGRWAGILNDIEERKTLPHDDRFQALMEFIAFMGVRVPRIRQVIDQYIGEVRRKEEFARKFLETGDVPSPDELARVAEDAGLDRTSHVQNMLEMARNIMPVLASRHWNLWIAQDDAPDLICSDSPVAPH